MLDRTTSKATPNAISSQEWEAGQEPYVSRVGRIIEQYGREAVLANLSPSQAAKVGLLTAGTYGPFFGTTSRSAALQSSLESRLRALLNGSDLCEVTWKPWTTPWGQCLSRPRARVRTTFGTDTGSWPTPTTRDHKDGGYCPNVPVNGLLGRMVWPTPTSLAPAKNGNNEAGNSAGLVAIRSHAISATWPTASANDGTGAKVPPGRRGGIALKQAVWQTPVADDALGRAKGKVNSRGEPKLSGQAILIGSSVPTEKPGALNPEFVCWLMGYPTEWLSCAP
jgi:hypothetical protein